MPRPHRPAGDAPADPESAAPVADAEPAFDESTASQEDVASPDGGGETGPAPDAGRRFMSPLVRRLVREHGIDLAGVTGSGPEGRIVRRDVEPLIAAKGTAPAESAAPGAEAAPAQEAAPAASAASTPPAPPAPATAPGADAELIPHTRMRRTIARRLVESKTQVPHFYLTAECRVDRLLELRRELNAAGTVKVSVNDLVVKAVAGALADVPEANRTWSDDGVLQHRAADIAIAVALDDGLVTPVVRGVEALSVSELGRRIADVAERARSGGLRQHEIEGGSFSVSNLGMYGTREFTAIINPPHAGILAVGAARRAPVVVDGVLEVGTVMSVTLSADHRVLDGAVAARWLAAFQARIEHPLTILA
ncbi:Dihydrolipoyllysine-residue succinyltransferase component of 2-oxoglutarate dehydrogenase complex [Agromyces sp. NDB4Y10]|uniref:dihydrolipoamide acetyltransferase family protein n=1 Tax=Agromyces sp. NDB4Y10 TaxID=1775951 RepID=UPI0007B1DEE4|nr:dihydrolipoamide acetyltransferase family protein [Agromyces sp. NDB4Y10]KZE92882.1 Dihydrolipoyllysine-residue succinyltransferase component of 2-oxoglutarate dehydrogenase complex [Agromyces sp. NDB4Y10]